MFLQIVILLVICLSLWLTIRWSQVKRYWEIRGVPHNPPHPIFGSLTFLQKENPTIWIRRLYREFKSPVVGIWLFWRPALVINCPELARRVLVKDSDNFRNRFLSSGRTDPIGGLNLFTVNDPTWSNIRRRLTVAFTAAKLRAVEGIIKAKCRDLMERIQQEITKGPIHNIRNLMTDFTTDVTGEAALGVSCDTTRTGSSILRTVTQEFMEFTTFRGLSWCSIFFCPALVDIFGFSFFPRHTVEKLRHVFRTIVSQRGGYEKEVTNCRDFFDALLKARQDAAKDGEEFSEDFLLSQAAILLLGGFDTTGSILTWISYEMAHAPHYQEMLYEELIQAKQNLNGSEFDTNSIAELPFLNACIKEILRKYPPMGWLDRIAAKDYQLTEQLTIPAGTVLYVNGTAMHMDPAYYPEPEQFKPERFMPENEKNVKPFTYLPFGDGPRVCIGIRFAFQAVRFCLASLFLQYRVTPLPNTPKPNEVEVEKKGLFYMPEQKLSLNFVPRK